MGSTLADLATPAPPARPLWARVQPGQFAPALGISGLALLLRRALGGAGSIDLCLLILAVGVWLVVALCILGKYLRYRSFLSLDLADPLRAPFMVTAGIALEVIGVGLGAWSLVLGRAFWLVGLGVTLTATLFLFRQWLTQTIQPAQMTPAWFFPIVGPGVAAIGGAGLGFPELSLLLYVGSGVGWLMMLPLMLSRLCLHDLPPPPMLPTLAILLAPPSIGAIAWAEMSHDPSSPLVLGLFGGALLMGLICLAVLPELLRAPFGPASWAYSFPLAALANAALVVAAAHPTPGWQMLAGALLGLAVAVIVGLMLRTLWALWQGRFLPA